MLTVKGFISIKEKISNEPTKVDPLGELPTYCVTYTKELGMYNHSNYKDVKLYTLYSKNEAMEDVELSNIIQAEILKVYTEIKSYCDNNVKPIKKDELLRTVRSNLALIVNNFTIGKFVDSESDELPAWFSFTSINNNFRCKIWLSGKVMLYDYDEFEIMVIPPVEDLNVFFQGLSAVEDALSRRSINDLLDIAQVAKDLHPETVTKVLTYKWTDRLGNSIDTNWVVLIYGVAGDTSENIKDAINEYCVDHSEYDTTEWKKYFKELFSRTEFVLIPRFDLYSIPSLYTEEGMFRSIIDPNEAIQNAIYLLPYYSSEHIRYNTRLLPYDYRGITIVSVAGDTNIEGYKKLEDILTDYIPVNSTSTDFMRMTKETREWCLAIEEMLTVAKNLDENSDIPEGYRRVRRHDRLYITKTINKVYYLMLTGVRE